MARRPDPRTGTHPVGLAGRQAELRLLGELLAEVRDGRSGVLVLVGEAGIGKTRLLDTVDGDGADLRVARIAGVESETRLGFAALHRLLRPFLDGLDRLPAPQRGALAAAFGLADTGTPADRYLVGLATLTLLADTATAARPLLCLVDDVQWLDRESAEVLAFVGRRLHADAVGLVLAGREGPAGPGPFDGLPSRTVTGLPDADARGLLAAGATGHLDRTVAGLIVAGTGGNPLALLELTRTLDPEQLAGTAPLPTPLPVGPLLEAHFLDRVLALPADTRTLLLVLSVAPPDDPAILWRAAAQLGVPARAADAATAAGVVTHHRTVAFRHPLIRSAVHRNAEPADRRRAHAALAAVTDPRRDPDRRAWHRAEATVGLDETVAAELAEASERARARGGYAARAAFLSRAAELSESGRAARLVAAAEACLVLGDPRSALAMLDRAEPELGADDPVLHARARRTRATVDLYFTGMRGISALLLDAARPIAELDPPLARRMLFGGMEVLVVSGPHVERTTPREYARAALASPALRTAYRPTVTDLLLRGFALRLDAGHAPALPLLREALALLVDGGEITEEGMPLAVLTSLAADDGWDDVLGREVWRVLDAHDRRTGALGALQSTLVVQSTWEVRAGRLRAAEACLDEAEQLAEVTGLPPAGPIHRIELMAWRGEEAAVRAAAGHIAEHWERTYGNGTFGAWAAGCLAVLEIGLGRHAEALACLRPAFDADLPGTGARLLHEVVEAAVRSGDDATAKAALARLEERATAAGTPWGLGLLARCRALTADHDQAEACYTEAVDLLGRTRTVAELARTRLAFGEWLRRRRRRADARVQLRAAHDMFTDMGAALFAERAAAELRATGEQARRRTGTVHHDLTPQERQVATLAAAGATNAEIAARLFISVSTVEYHLNKVFRKLGVSSRRQLSPALEGEA
ncbi:LuxR C-terminal-related transcriptional regulator [Streptomyces sp. NPDC090306]|uniref:LuxR C-terminal-related transcriptional regulator n=1 Tax=unclassified Streptomyces TaxID=2593676 RepID=UPI0036EBB4E8